MLNLPSLQEEHNPLTMVKIHNNQQADDALMQAALKDPNTHNIKNINGINVICMILEHYNPIDMNWKIFMQDLLICESICWY